MPSSAGVDAEHPWPGLMPFTEDASDYFHGREHEAIELLRLIKRECLTVLFGQSGLGKSSLLNAGLFPRLRAEDYFPIYIRPDVAATAPGLADQVKAEIVANCEAHGVDATEPTARASLWEYFHRRDTDFWSLRNRLLVPVLVFDQFEEIFTLGRHAEELESRCLDFVSELADLIEDRMPQELTARLEENPALGEQFDYARRRCKVLFCFREDYLPEFEGLRVSIRSIMQNRMRLTRMSGSAAHAAILKAGGALLSTAVAEQIVRFVAAPRGGRAEDDMDRQEVEPALLSVVCRELNNQRIREGRAQITADLLQAGAQQGIIRDFYEASFADLDIRVRHFVEDQLLTDAGYRDSVALDDALLMPTITRASIDTLIGRRLLRLEERSGVLRVELTHDVLTQVARESRDLRKAEQERMRLRTLEALRRRRIRRLGAIGTIAFVTLLGIAVVFAILLKRADGERRHLIETQSLMLLSRANTELDQGIPAEPYALLAQAIRLNRDNRAAVARGISLLEQRSHAVQISTTTLSVPQEISWYDATHYVLSAPQRVAWATLGEAPAAHELQVRVADGEHEDFGFMIPERSAAPAPSASAETIQPYAYHAEARVFSVISTHMVAHLFDPATLKPVGRSVQLAGIPMALRVSPGRTWLAALDGKGNLLIASLDDTRQQTFSLGGQKPAAGNALPFVTDQGVALVRLEKASSLFRLGADRIDVDAGDDATVSPDGQIAAISGGTDIRLYKLPDGRPAGPEPLSHQGAVRAMSFSPDGKYLASASLDKHARIWDVSAQKLAGDMKHDGAVLSVHFAGSANVLITGSADGAARVWQPFSAEQLVDPMVHADAVVDALPQPDGEHLLTMTYSHQFSLWRWRDPQQPQVLRVGPAAGAELMEVSPKGRLLALAGATGELDLLDTSNPAAPNQLWSAAGSGKAIAVLRFSPDGSLLAVANADGFLTFLDSKTGRQRGARMHHGRAVHLLQFSADGRYLISAGQDRRTRLWDVTRSELAGLSLDHASEPAAVAFGKENGQILIALKDRLQLWDVRTGALQDEILLLDSRATEQGERVLWAAYGTAYNSANVLVGKRLIAIRLKSNKQGESVFDHETRRELLLGDFRLWTAAVSPGEDRLAVGALDGRIRVIDLPGFAILGETMKHDDTVTGLAFSEDGERLLSWSLDGSIRIWDSESGYPAADPIVVSRGVGEASGPVAAARFVSQDDSLALATRGSPATIRLLGKIPPGSVPPWLQHLLELAGGGQLDAQGASVRIPDRLGELERFTATQTDSADPWQMWAREVVAKLIAPATPQNMPGGKR